MSVHRQRYLNFGRHNRRPRPESPSAADRRKFSESVGGIDYEVQQFFLHLPPDKLCTVFRHYGEVYGKGALSYAKQTYTRWQSGI